MSGSERKSGTGGRKSGAAAGGGANGAVDTATPPRPLRDGIDTDRPSRVATGGSATPAGEPTGGAVTTRETVMGAYATGRDRASEAYQAAFDRARSAADAAAVRIDASPVASLAGGIALGVVIGALLPRTDGEAKLYGSIGDRLGDLAIEATGAARDAGRAKLTDMGVSQDRGRDILRTVVDALVQAAVAAGSAALTSARETRTPRD